MVSSSGDARLARYMRSHHVARGGTVWHEDLHGTRRAWVDVSYGESGLVVVGDVLPERVAQVAGHDDAHDGGHDECRREAHVWRQAERRTKRVGVGPPRLKDMDTEHSALGETGDLHASVVAPLVVCELVWNARGRVEKSGTAPSGPMIRSRSVRRVHSNSTMARPWRDAFRPPRSRPSEASTAVPYSMGIGEEGGEGVSVSIGHANMDCASLTAHDSPCHPRPPLRRNDDVTPSMSPCNSNDTRMVCRLFMGSVPNGAQYTRDPAFFSVKPIPGFTFCGRGHVASVCPEGTTQFRRPWKQRVSKCPTRSIPYYKMWEGVNGAETPTFQEEMAFVDTCVEKGKLSPLGAGSLWWTS